MMGSEYTDVNGDGNTSSFDVSYVSCSICLDLVTDKGDRSRAKLQCGHEFHLDCIGSAFNMKGAMQCPNCRKVERGRWLYASGSTCSFPEFSMDELTADEDPYELSYPEMPFRVHWCPFSGLAQVHSSLEEVESPSTTYHNIHRRNALFAEHTAASSVAHSYLAYFGPIPPSLSNSTNESVEDLNFNHRWNAISGPNEIFTAQGFPVIDIQYHSWGQHSHPFSSNSGHINSTDQASVPPATLRSTRAEYDAMTRSGSSVHPFVYGHGNSRPHDRTLDSHGIHQQQQPSNHPGIPSRSAIPGVRRTNGQRGLPPAVPATSQSDHNGGFSNFHPPAQNLHEAENSLLNCGHGRERNHLSPFPVISFDRDSTSGWGSFQHAASGSDSTNRSGSFWPRYQS
ncbi:hypothetical protein U1Q18_034322 [Sarracenia purpurea var. burkii]